MVAGGAIRAGRAFVELFLDDKKLTTGLRRGQAALKSFGSTVSSLGARMAGFGALLSAPFAASAITFANFTDEMAKVGAVSQATGEELAKLTEKSKQLGRETSFTAIQAAEGMTALGRAGFNTAQILDAIPNFNWFLRESFIYFYYLTNIFFNFLDRQLSFN